MSKGRPEATEWELIASIKDDEAASSGRADRNGRLVLADWLDERGDPRGDFIRTEELLLQRSPAADEYWALKARRNSLRRHCDSEFLRELGYHGAYQPSFVDWPQDWLGRWRVIRECVDRWFRVDLPDCGAIHEPVVACEQQLGRPLPPSVREWIAFVSDVSTTPAAALIPSGDQFQRMENPLRLSLKYELEGDVRWMVCAADFDADDPPFGVSALGFAADYRRTLTEAAVRHVLSRAPCYSSISRNIDWTPSLREQLKGELGTVREFSDFVLLENTGVLGFVFTEYSPARLYVMQQLPPEELHGIPQVLSGIAEAGGELEDF